MMFSSNQVDLGNLIILVESACQSSDARLYLIAQVQQELNRPQGLLAMKVQEVLTSRALGVIHTFLQETHNYMLTLFTLKNQ